MEEAEQTVFCIDVEDNHNFFADDILVHNCQDFTLLELDLVRKWLHTMEYGLLAGDDDQCCYQFKGAEPDAFLDPPIDDEFKRVLSQSYRVPRKIQRLSQAWISQVARREEKNYEPRDVDGRILIRGRATWKNPGAAVDLVEEFTDAGQSVMILASCGYMLSPVIRTLRQRAIPFWNPYAKRRGDWNPLQPGSKERTMPSGRVVAFTLPQVSEWGDAARMWTADDVNKWASYLSAKGCLIRGAKKEIQGLSDDTVEVPISDLLGWFEPEALDRALEGDLEWYLDAMMETKQNAMGYPIKIALQRGARTLIQTPKVIVGTGHSVKGGEADAVVMFPDFSTAGAKERSTRRGRDAMTRLFYVMMTRARETLVLCRAAGTEYAEIGTTLEEAELI